MSTYSSSLHQIVFGTKHCKKDLLEERRQELFKYIFTTCKNMNCIPFAVNGVEDHLHIIASIPPSLAPSELVKTIKLSSSQLIKDTNMFPSFDNWQRGYGHFTYSPEAKQNLIRYVMNQEEHHRKISFHDEYVQLLKEHHISFDERFILK